MYIDLGVFGWFATDAAFFAGLMQIMIINIILSGDNAVVIALAVRGLEHKERKWGIILGSALAVVLRIVLVGFAVVLLTVPFLKLVGGALILWIAVKLFTEGHGDEDVAESAGIWQAVRVILIADLVMSIDNVLAIAGAASGNMFLIIIGLATSIPLIVGTSALLTMLMDKYPIIITLGAAILGKVGGEMMITDHWVETTFHPSHAVDIGVQIFFTIGVVVVGKMLLKLKIAKEEKLAAEGGPAPICDDAENNNSDPEIAQEQGPVTEEEK
ncbi:MAG: TerC family protein [bacterium]|nr:TerC family protein [bacterium]MDT8366250.1 TerC family protein [bacterium]